MNGQILTSTSMGATESTIVDLRAIHPDAAIVRVLGINYVHFKTNDDGDIYLTPHGLPRVRCLVPESWFDNDWFTHHRVRLPGSSTVYHVRTRPAGHNPGIEIVVKWSRVGQDALMDAVTMQRNISAEFNSPFEEFALVEDLRKASRQAPIGGRRVYTQQPLAIYVPPDQMQPWQTGRSDHRLQARIARHPSVALDVLRAYILIYQWVEGISSVDAYRACCSSMAEGAQLLHDLTHEVDADLAQYGFVVADHKPTHFIVRIRNGKVRKRHSRVAYALCDFELLARTAESESARRAALRRNYLVRMRERFMPRPAGEYNETVKSCSVLDVPYVFSRVESTQGVLWVVGHDPELVRYFFPERWRTHLMRLSETRQSYYTLTKDLIELMWKVSRVGEIPPGDLADAEFKRKLFHGYNAPFEEFALASRATQAGIKTAMPRAIYMTGLPEDLGGAVLDERRFEHFANILGPDGEPVLPLDHDYVVIWGYWTGYEDHEQPNPGPRWTAIGADLAASRGLISSSDLPAIMERHAALLASKGFEDLNLKPDHLLLSYIPGGPLKQTPDGQIEVRHCNFELVRMIGKA